MASQCYAVFSNNQGPKNGLCPFYHYNTDHAGDMSNQRSKIIQLQCHVKFHFFTPVLINDRPSTNHLVIVSYGTHMHPPPPARRVPPQVKERVLKAIQAFGVGEATARKLISSPILPIMLNGRTTLSQEHVSLTNQDVVNYLIRKERLKEYPWGTDFQGVQYLMKQENPDQPYIRQTRLFDNGRFIILLQSREQSRLLMRSTELHADKTFSRTKCQEFEINGYDPVSRRLVTLARIFMDSEDEWSYCQAFLAMFDTAEKDEGHSVPFGHLTTDEKSPTGSRIKAILVDLHGGQIRGLANYFNLKYPNDDPNFHIRKIVKTCRVHFQRAIKNLLKKNSNSLHQGKNSCKS